MLFMTNTQFNQYTNTADPLNFHTADMRLLSLEKNSIKHHLTIYLNFFKIIVPQIECLSTI